MSDVESVERREIQQLRDVLWNTPRKHERSCGYGTCWCTRGEGATALAAYDEAKAKER